MVLGGGRISIFISRTSPGLITSILSGLNSTVHFSGFFEAINVRLRTRALPAFPTRISTGVLFPAVREVFSVSALVPILKSGVPLSVTFIFFDASKAPARALTVTGYSPALACTGESISTLKVSVPFSFRARDDIIVSPYWGLKRTTQPSGACATRDAVSGLLISFLRSTVNLRICPVGVVKTGYWLVSLSPPVSTFLEVTRYVTFSTWLVVPASSLAATFTS